MENVPNDDFLRWADSVGIGFDPYYPEARCLTPLPICDHARFWLLPNGPASWPHFAASLLAGLDAWESGHLWPHSGNWPDPRQSKSHHESVRDILLRGACIPACFAGAVRFDRAEERKLVAVLFACFAFGWCRDDDLFFVPDHGRQLLQTDHHGVVHVRCRSEERIEQLVTHMADLGHELPTEPPDWTFKWQMWMANMPEPMRRALLDIQAAVEELNRDYEQIVTDQDFEKAASLRDRAENLRRKKERILSEGKID